MKLRLTDGSEFELEDCKQECDTATNENLFVCTLENKYDFIEVSNILKKNEIAEILSVLDETGFIFQSKDYRKVKSVTNDIKTNKIQIIFSSRK